MVERLDGREFLMDGRSCLPALSSILSRHGTLRVPTYPILVRADLAFGICLKVICLCLLLSREVLCIVNGVVP